jgi:predicted MFS family arabinose efflux permease
VRRFECGRTGLAASATSVLEFAIGYAVLFGPGAGVLFTVSQQAVNQTVTRSRGLASGYVVSLYPLGAMLGAPILGWSIQAFGVRPALWGLAGVVVAACSIAAALFRLTAIRTYDEAAVETVGVRHGREFYFLVAVFFLAAAAGLMVLSQAAAIVQSYGGATAFAVAATTFITGAVGAARIAGGWLVDHFSPARVGVAAHLCSLAGAVMLSMLPTPLVAACALALIGAGYGFVSGWSPARLRGIGTRMSSAPSRAGSTSRGARPRSAFPWSQARCSIARAITQPRYWRPAVLIFSVCSLRADCRPGD